MIPKRTKIGKYKITYLCKEELNILKKEIFSNQIYKIDLESKKPVIFDIGSHIGLSILYFKTLFPKSSIYGFEPNPNTFPILEENIYGNNIDNIKLDNVAIGKRNEERDLYIDNSGYGAFSTSSFHMDAWNGKQKTIPIKVKTEKISKHIDKYIDLIKIDTEGEELNILEEIEESEKFKYIRNLIIEYHPINKNRFRKIVSILNRNNYTIDTKDQEEGLVLIVAKNHSNKS